MPKRPVNPLKLLDPPRWSEQEPSWRQADPALIEAATTRALGRPGGGWVVLCGSREVAPTFGRTVAGREIVVWRTASGDLLAGPGACPHLGAALCDAPVVGENLVCRWHGLPLGRDWGTYPVHDDGVLVRVRLDALGEPPLDAPVLGPRPPSGVSAVATVIGRCEPRDVLANRLDPWHGSWFHPYSFASLSVLDAPRVGAADAEDRFLVEVSFRVAGRLGVPVKAAFSCPDPRTVTMEIVDGEGTGSVVETHATPLGPGPDGAPRTAVIEAVVAYSDRRGFAHVSRIGAALRPFMRATAARLWKDDIAYAERRYTLRARG